MPKLPSLTPAEIIKLLLNKGFIVDRIKGSHHILYNENIRIRSVVPMHKTIYQKVHFMK
jgi:predicted RNA binding protein YcfA (HicA-like mRNA interferase family)